MSRYLIVTTLKKQEGGETIIAEGNEDFMLLKKTVGNSPLIKSFSDSIGTAQVSSLKSLDIKHLMTVPQGTSR